jgi:gliding motility-associated-like protein
MKKLILLWVCAVAFASGLKAQVPTNQDCLGAIPICQNIYSNPASYSGTGNYPNEINAGISCLATGELNDVWYQFTVQQSGNVCFSITPVALSDDYDWAVYNLTNNNCSDIYNNSSLEVSCNYSGTAGVTGANGQSGSQNNPCIPVTAGQTYVINVSNYSSTTSGYTIDFSASSAVIFDNVPPNILSVNQPVACGASSLTFNFSENVLCSTVSTSDFTLTGPGGPYTISAISGAACAVGGTSENTFTINVSPPIISSGNYSLNLVGSVTDLCGNVAPAGSLAFTINATPAPSAPSPAPVCQGNPVPPLTASGSNITWYSDQALTTVAGTGSPWSSGATSSVSYWVTQTVNGCQSSATQVNITINPSPNVTVTGAGPFCLADPAVNLSGSPGGGTWSGTGITNTSAGTFDPSAAGVGNHTITYAYTDANGCQGTATTTVAVNTGGNPAVNPAGPFCANSAPATLTASSGGGTWSGSGITNASAGTFDPGAAGPGSHAITYTIPGACGGTGTTTITVNAVPNSAISPSGPYCIGDPAATLTAATAGGSWSGTGIINSSAGTFDPNIAGVGSHTINYTVTMLGCTSTSTASITVNSSATATITAAGPFCANDTAVSLLATGPGGVWAGPGITDAANGTFDPAVAGAGVHNIIYTLAGACGDTDTVAITVNAIPAAPLSTSPLVYCSGNPIAPLTATGTGGTLTWYSQLQPPTVAGTGSPWSPGVSSSATFWVTETVAGCEGTPAQVDIIVNPSPVLGSVPATIINASCGLPNGSVSAIDIISGLSVPNTFSWTDDNGDTVSTGSPDAWYLPAGNYFLTIINGYGCSAVSGPHSVLDLGSINAAFSATPSTGQIPLTVSFTDLSTGASSYQWNFGDGNSSTGTDPINIYTAGGVYTVSLIVANSHGCTDTAMATIIADALSVLTVPNVFSPNGDGINDEFVMTYQNITVFTAQVFNRWGEKVFEWTDIKSGWDGRSASGNEVSAGTYFYVIDAKGIDGQSYAITGTVTLLK